VSDDFVKGFLLAAVIAAVVHIVVLYAVNQTWQDAANDINAIWREACR
jgi:hypothetical protein